MNQTTEDLKTELRQAEVIARVKDKFKVKKRRKKNEKNN